MTEDDFIPPVPEQIAFQGELGAYGHLACRRAWPDLAPLPCASFEDAFAAVTTGQARYAMIPIENTLAGRVPDIHHLLPDSGLFIVGEHFLRVRHQLLGLPGARLEEIGFAHSHPMAIGQCRDFLRQRRISPVKEGDTAGAARLVKLLGDTRHAAIASSLAAEVNGLVALAANIEDAPHNTTRFIVMAREQATLGDGARNCVTALVFEVRNVPAALFKGLGGFATNGVNMTKLESYMVGGSFTATQFYAEIEGRPEDRVVTLALEELAFFSNRVRILGVFEGDPFRYAGTPAPNKT